jgi:hypothetical protein
VAAKGVGEVGDGPGPHVCRGLVCLTSVLVCIGIAFSPYIVAVVFLVHVLLSETDNNEEGIETADSSRLMLVGIQLSKEVLLKLL